MTKVALGIIYTPYLPGGNELEDALHYASKVLGDCTNVHIFDAATDALTLLEEIDDAEALVLVGPGCEEGVKREEYTLPTRRFEIHEVPDEIRASLEGSLLLKDAIRALDALAAVEGRRLHVVAYRCGRGSCRRALREAIMEAGRLAGCLESQ